MLLLLLLLVVVPLSPLLLQATSIIPATRLKSSQCKKVRQGRNSIGPTGDTCRPRSGACFCTTPKRASAPTASKLVFSCLFVRTKTLVCAGPTVSSKNLTQLIARASSDRPTRADCKGSYCHRCHLGLPNACVSRNKVKNSLHQYSMEAENKAGILS